MVDVDILRTMASLLFNLFRTRTVARLARPLSARAAPRQAGAVQPDPSNEMLRLKRPRFGEQKSAKAVLDLVDLYGPLLEHCDLAAAFFRVASLSERRSADRLIAAEPRFPALVAAIREHAAWRRADLAAVWRGTAYLRLGDEQLHAALRAVAERKAATFDARELANIFSGVPFISPADSRLHGKLSKRAGLLATQLSPKEVASILHVLPALQPLPSLPPLVAALCEQACAQAPRFGAEEVSTALRAACALRLPRSSALVEAMLRRLDAVVLDMAVHDLRQTLVALQHFGEDGRELGKRVKADLDFKRQQRLAPRAGRVEAQGR